MFASALIAQAQRPVVDIPAPWDPIFSDITTLAFIHDAYGKGRHRNFVPTEPLTEVITSRLEKGGKVWEIGTKEAFYIDFYRSSSGSGQRERLFTSTPLIYARGSLVLVDAVEEQNDITILAAGFEDYICFKLRRKPVIQAGSGFYVLEPYATNSEHWYLDAVIHLDCLGHKFSGGTHSWIFNSVKLVSASTIEVEVKGSPNIIETIDFSTGIPLKGGISVQSGPTPVPPGRPMAPHSETAILEFFGVPAGDDLKWRVLRVEGGKTRVFEVLDQLSDQTQVPTIKQTINESM
jgi:hypothetical protein